MHDYTETELAAMTPAEREAVDFELNDDKPSVTVDSAEVEAANAAKNAADAEAAEKAKADKAAADDVAATAATDAAAALAAAEKAKVDDAAAAAAATATPAAAAAVAPPAAPFVPVFKAPLVTDEQHATAQAALAEKFSAGDITTPQFIAENDKLTRAKMESDFAAKNAEQSEEQSWQHQQDQFFAQPGNAIIRDDARVWGAMQAQLEVLYKDESKRHYTNDQFLAEAGAEVRKLFGIGAAPAAAAAKAPTALDGVAIPKTLEGLPAAEAHADTSGEFAAVDKLDGMEYENAIARMTPEQKSRYMAM